MVGIALEERRRWRVHLACGSSQHSPVTTLISVPHVRFRFIISGVSACFFACFCFLLFVWLDLDYSELSRDFGLGNWRYVCVSFCLVLYPGLVDGLLS